MATKQPRPFPPVGATVRVKHRGFPAFVAEITSHYGNRAYYRTLAPGDGGGYITRSDRWTLVTEEASR